jgi:hypothetical protein
MREESFWNLLDLIEDKLGKVDGKRKRGKAPNGNVSSSVRLAIALRYLAGGNPIDICAVYRVHSSVVYQSIWMVVEAINKTKELQIQFPTKHEDQQVLANEFTHRSSIGLNNCAGCVDGILIWINKPTIPELQKLAEKNSFVGAKKNSVLTCKQFATQDDASWTLKLCIQEQPLTTLLLPRLRYTRNWSPITYMLQVNRFYFLASFCMATMHI